MAKPTFAVCIARVTRGASMVLAMLVLLATPAAAQADTCPKGLKSHAVAEMIFGRNIGDVVGGVSEEEWLRFLDEVVTPRFSDGLTVIDAYGQWWNAPEASIEREPSKILLIVLKNETAQRAQLAEIAVAYKRRFSQQSVILMLRRACIAF
jgi:Protein of unknown function (DUF3574)